MIHFDSEATYVKNFNLETRLQLSFSDTSLEMPNIVDVTVDKIKQT